LFDKKKENTEAFETWVPLVSTVADKIAKNKNTKEDTAGSDNNDFDPLYSYGKGSDPQDGFTAIYSPGSSSPSENITKKPDPENSTSPEGSVDNEGNAYDDGFAKGEKDGFDEGKKRAAEMINSIQEILGKVEDLWPKMISEYEEKIMQLVYRAAEKVVYGHIDIDNDIVKRAILNVFELIPKPIDVTININPDDYEYIETIKEDLLKNIKQLKNISIVSNPSVSRGGCLVESRAGDADSSVEKRLESIKKSIVSASDKNRNKHPI